MIAGKQHVRNLDTTPFRGLRVLAVLQQRVLARIRFLNNRFRVAHKTGQQSRNRFQHDRNRDLTAVQHIIADRIFTHVNALRAVILRNARVIPFVTAAAEQQMIGMAQFRRILLREQWGGRIRKNQHRTCGRSCSVSFFGILSIGRRLCSAGICNIAGICRILNIFRILNYRRLKLQQLVKAFAPHFRLHHHARATADRSVVDGMMHVVRPIAQIMGGHFHKTFRLRFAEQTEVQHFEIFRENGHDINLHNDSRIPVCLPNSGKQKVGMESNAHLISNCDHRPGISPPGGSRVR